MRIGQTGGCLGAIAFLLAVWLPPFSALAAVRWDPENTRLVVVSLAAFAGEKEGHTSFSTSDRLDDPLVELFREKGVAEEKILYLKDGDAKTTAVKAEFKRFILDSQKGETLIFYYSSHGGYDSESGQHTFTTFDGSIPVGWFAGTIEGGFRGSRALIFSDCCYSGGIVELVKARPPCGIEFGALSTTGTHNVGYSGWRFTDVLIRAWSGDVAFDLDGSKTVDFGELCQFAEKYMAFVAEGKPLYATRNAFDSNLVLADADRASKKLVGYRLEAKEGDKWFKAEVVDVRLTEGDTVKEVRVHFTDKNRYQKYAWLKLDDVRDYEYPTYEVGESVEIRDEHGKWVPGKVLAVFESMHECRYEAKSSAYDEWMSPGRIRERRRKGAEQE